VQIAVIGSGISGMAAAYYLSRKHEVSLFEKEARIGGHTHTVTVDSSQGPLAVDTGFIVHNNRAYPNLQRLFRELGVETQPSDMSFAVHSPATGFQYSSRGLRGFFARRRNALRLSHYKLFAEMLRFHREAPKILQQPGAERASLADFLAEGRYHSVFVERYLYPMASAVWSMSMNAMNSFPAATMIRFFNHHGMLTINRQPKWFTVRGGSNEYIAPLTKPYRDRMHMGAGLRAIARSESGITLRFTERPEMHFDQVVFACHGDQVLPLLESPTEKERDVLGGFETSANEVCLHTDSRMLPTRAHARASWNYCLNEHSGQGATVTYHMNRLQSLAVKEDYCVSLNANGFIDPAKVLRRFVYRHPLYTRLAVAAQQRWKEISGANRTHFCGAYWFYGFHEDGVNSALRVAQTLGVE
jgi:predicted NAD/FAD-binding protein